MNFRKNGLWLTAQWDFIPDQWGVVGFTIPTDCNNFFDRTSDGTIVAIYLTKQNKINRKQAGKVVGFVRLSRKKGWSEEFVCEDLWKKNQANHRIKGKLIITAGKWIHGVQITQAWRVKEDDRNDVRVGTIFQKTYKSKDGQTIATQGRQVDEADFANVDGLNIYEVSVFKPIVP